LKPWLFLAKAVTRVRQEWAESAAITFLVALPLALFWPALRHGLLIYGPDTVAIGIPSHAEAVRSLAAHEWPLWMPDLLGGMPGIAANNLLFLMPADLIAYLAGWTFQTQIAVDAVLWTALAGIGMLLFLRNLDRSVSASLLGGLFFATSGSVISQLGGGYHNMMQGAALAPWAFWAAQRGLRRGSWFSWGLCGLVLALQVLAQAAQLAAYTLPAVAVFALASAWNRDWADGSGGAFTDRRAAFRFAIGGLAASLILAVLISAPQLWLSLQYLSLTTRQAYSHGQFVAGSIPPAAALTWWMPGSWRFLDLFGRVGGDFGSTTLYLGLLPWALAVGALAAPCRSGTRAQRLAILGLAAFVLALRPWNPLQSLAFHLPVFNRFQNWSRVLFLGALAVCALAAFGWDALLSPSSRKAVSRGVAAFYALVLALAGGAWVFSGSHGSPLWAGPLRASALAGLALVCAGSLLLWLAARRPRTALVLALLLHGVDQGAAVRDFVRFVDPGAVVGATRFVRAGPPQAGAEPWRVYDEDQVHPNNALVSGYENMCGTASMPMGAYFRIADAMKGRLRDWYDLFSARYVFAHSKPHGSTPGDAVTVYGNPEAFPRAWLVTRVRKVADDGEAYGLLADPAFRPRVEAALPEDPGLSGLPPVGAVEWLDRSPQTASLRVSTDRDAVLVLSNAWYPSWRAQVDGQASPVLKADGGLQALLLKAGRHTVDIRFDNGLFDDALAACLAGLFALIGLALYDADRRRKVRN
jgi:hypothetical protein